eukprot:TRINITY_DN6017_c0_g2_i1.p1 TRINITY_DN6017_c0_g2~~TRINITY_DN6017_c0_g2_i1.p1  ORF type:complete len:377 (+),score=34.33 TRINITY_DN6017_c0_g2_i1:170-1300(+)
MEEAERHLESSGKESWLPLLSDFFLHHFFPSLRHYNSIDDIYSCRQVSKCFRQHRNPPRVTLAPAKFKSVNRMLAIAPVVEKLTIRNFMDASNVSRFIDSLFFANAKSLRVLQLELCPRIKPAALGLLMANIAKLPNLTELDLTGAQVDTAAFEAMAKSAVPCSSLLSLRLPQINLDNYLDGGSMATILCKLTSLESLCIFPSSSHPLDLASMFEAVGDLRKLTHLEISSQRGPSIRSYVASATRRLTNLQSLYLPVSSTPNEAGLQELLKAIENHPSLTQLAVPYSSQEIAATVSRSLLRNTTLKALSFASAQIADLDLMGISEMLVENKTLTSLDLNSTCRVSNSSLEHLGHALAQNSSLKWLNMVGLTGMGLE